jgi:MFS family permease
VTGVVGTGVPNDGRGLYVGVGLGLGGIGRVVGPLWAGFAFDSLGRGVPFWTGAALAAFTVFLGVGIEQHGPQGQRPALPRARRRNDRHTALGARNGVLTDDIGQQGQGVSR